MKYIREFNQYEQIDEKITFQEIAMYFALLLASYNTYTVYNNYKEINKLYTIANSASYDGTIEQKHQIDSLKKNIIEQIRISPKFDKNIKPYILDSLQNVTIKFADPTGNLIKKRTGAFYMKLSNFENSLKNSIYSPLLTINKTSIENIIIVNKKYENDGDLVNVLVHEIYHYVDMLLGQKTTLSKELNLTQFIDKNVKNKNKDYISRKFMSIIGKDIDNISPKAQRLLKKLSNTVSDQNEYLTSSSEIFARWKTFKSYMVKKGYIKDMNSPVSTELFKEYISSNSNLEPYDSEFLLAIDWNKIPELDKLSR